MAIRVLYRAPSKNLVTIMVARFFALSKSGFSLIFSLMKSPDRNRLDKLFHPLSAILFHLLRNMAVNIQCESSCGMAEIFLHSLNVVAAFDAGNRVGVAQVVKTGSWRAYFFHNALEAVIHRAIG